MAYALAAAQPPVIEIYTADGLFIKQMHIASAGTLIPQHAHAWDHTSMLAAGAVRVMVDGKLMGEYVAPTGIFIKAGIKHLFVALADNTTIWCIHNLHGEAVVKVLSEHNLMPGDI